MFRSRVKWYEEGEKNTKYFYNLEKARYNAKTCYKIITENNEEIVQSSEILKEQRNFFAELYSEDEDVKFTLVNEYGIYVPECVKEVQEKSLVEVDFQEAIKGMNNDKTPGKDGIPVDFYKVFWIRIKEVFMEMVEEVYETEYLHETARQGGLEPNT